MKLVGSLLAGASKPNRYQRRPAADLRCRPLPLVGDLPAKSSTGAHGKNTCWQAVLATDWSQIDPFG